MNSPPSRIDPLGTATYDFQNEIYYRRIDFQPKDVVILPDGTRLDVTSSNVWPPAEGSSLQKLSCVLRELGFSLPEVPHPVYFGAFRGNAWGWTVDHGIFPEKRPTFLDAQRIEGVNILSAGDAVVTVWHELVGHNRDNGDDSDAFDLKYEAPIHRAIQEKRARKIYSGNKCASCIPSHGRQWQMQDAFDAILCTCDIPGIKRQ